jgi:hypothetical protein
METSVEATGNDPDATVSPSTAFRGSCPERELGAACRPIGASRSRGGGINDRAPRSAGNNKEHEVRSSQAASCGQLFF